MKRRLLLVLTVLAVIIVYFTGFFIKKDRDFRENLLLKRENENLRGELQLAAAGVKETGQKNYLPAKVFSTYPFNFKNKITVNVGEKNGVKKSAVVVFGENILVGQIADVSRDFSVARTIFDPGWQLPVRIGKEEINGLLQGGNEPKIVLIENDKLLETGLVVYSAGEGIPYGLKVGEIKEISKDAMGVFKEAFLKMPFNVGDLREVNIGL
ncbi:rod shape-determining protein MreC [Candidatus Wolfebacteria bacterium]|nr:rod shape-determining protein MreC [Candidatus Wolfebacteria bacterium]